MASVSLFEKATNVNLRNNDITIHTGRSASTNDGNELTGLALIRFRSALSALVDSSERFDSPRCSEETREAIIQQIIDWVNDAASPALLWLYGGAGAGKSALAQTIADIYKDNGRLAASFFFSRTAPGRSDGNSFVPTLILQFIRAFPFIKYFIILKLHLDPTILSKSRHIQMLQLVVKPLQLISTLMPLISFLWKLFLLAIFAVQSMIGPSIQLPYGYGLFSSLPQRPILVVVDGLDECNDKEVQCDLVRIIADIIPRFPLPIRFLIASRPEAHIRRTFDYDGILQAIQTYRLNLSADLNANADIERYLRQSFEHIRRTHALGRHLDPQWPSNYQIRQLVQTSSSHFVYAAIVVHYIQSHKHLPDDRLRVVLGLSTSNPPDSPLAALDAIYTLIFSEVEDEYLPTVLLFLGILCVDGRDENFIHLELSCEAFDEVLTLRKGALHVMVEPLSSLLSLPSYQEAKDIDRVLPPKEPQVFHASLFDFLLDPNRSDRFYIDLKSAHEALAKYIIRTWFSPGVSEIFTPSNDDFDVYDQLLSHLTYTDEAHFSDSVLPNFLVDFACFYTMFLIPFLISSKAHGQLINLSQRLADWLSVLCRPELDLHGVLRFGHLQKVAKKLEEGYIQSEFSTKITGSPQLSTGESIQTLCEPVRVGENLQQWRQAAFDVVVQVLSQWSPDLEGGVMGSKDVKHRDLAYELGKQIFSSIHSRGADESFIRTIECGQLLHLLLITPTYNNSFALSLISYLANNMEFHSHRDIQDYNSPGPLFFAVSNHIRQLELSLQRGCTSRTVSLRSNTLEEARRF
ncbi:hypothetical protein CPB83DRAFT_859158 [Crepidotus variabilis]|uniref:Nephrocystin 3-like N-terminal domain-containing protein n=1 Tax=Crepidotus variabilis TaxID=179855 RepID=A0A9P6EB37_9AGAR|nr:hypothetical protein CPB83DRAFT_859158 [Crepidotus variabilis]